MVIFLERRKVTVIKNLRAEMARIGLSGKNVADTVGILNGEGYMCLN